MLDEFWQRFERIWRGPNNCPFLNVTQIQKEAQIDKLELELSGSGLGLVIFHHNYLKAVILSFKTCQVP